MTEICYPKTAQLLSVDQAQVNIQSAIYPIDQQETIKLTQALGRILAQSVISPIHNPPDRNAAMDGYAFSSADIIKNQAFTLNLVGTSWAGKPYTGPVKSQQCVRIFTGAVVPDFADSVIAQEQVNQQDEKITFPIETQPFKNIRAVGSDVKQGDLLLSAPKALNACDLGLLAAVGIEQIQVRKPLKIGFFSTGDELVAIGQPLEAGQIYDSNRYLLAGLLNSPNHIITDLGVIPDDQQLLEKTLITAAQQFDVLISTGGASVGDKDFVKQTLEKCGQVNFWKLAIKPGKPLAFGKIKSCWFFGLPGNPIAVLVTYEQFVKPALLKLAGAPTSFSIKLQACCETRLHKSPGRQEYQRGIFTQTGPGEFTVKAAGQQESHQLKVASQANCFILLEQESSGVEVGEMVNIEPFGTRIYGNVNLENQ